MYIKQIIAFVAMISAIIFAIMWYFEAPGKHIDASPQSGFPVAEIPSLIDLGEQERGQVIVARLSLKRGRCGSSYHGNQD